LRKRLSKLIVFLLAIRPTFNVFYSTVLFYIGNYPVSLLSVWSTVYLILVAIRLLMPPPISSGSLKWSKAFIIWILIVGAPRYYFPEALIVDIGYALIVLLSIEVSAKIFADFSVDQISRKITYGALLLILVHSTAKFWYHGPTSYAEAAGAGRPALHNYIGAFGSKQLASISFFVLLPFLLISCLRKGGKISFVLFVSSVFFLIWTLYRTYIFCFLLGTTAFLMSTRKFFYALLTVVIIGMSFVILPKESLETFFVQKIQSEYESFLSGDISALGAGRVGIYLYGLNFFARQMNPIQKLFGLGSGHNFSFHETVIGGRAFAHGQWIALMVDYGIIGLLIFILFLWALYSDIQKAPYPEAYMRAVMFGLFIAIIGLCSVGHFLQKGGTGALLAFPLGYPIYLRWTKKWGYLKG